MADKAPHYYGGQALLEGVMMRGKDTWAVAVRRPNADIYVETHQVKGLAARHPAFRKPFVRGIAVMGDSLSIGLRAMMIAANQSLAEDEKLTPKQMGFTIAFAVAAFIGIFIVLPNLLGNATNDKDTIASHLIEGAIRLGIFVGYLVLISFIREIRRVFQYHGAEHKTIAAYEAEEPVLEPAAVDKYSTLHVRCGTNFLIIVVLLTVVVYSFLGRPALWLQLLERVGMVFVLAGISYEGLRLGAAHGDNPIVRALMKPGLWLQKITTRPPDRDQIEVAIRSFEAVLPPEQRTMVAALPSPLVHGDSLGGYGDVHADDDGSGEPER
ncbi:MAG TPA: DUF1385 domain-containing protein [Actinomycetota bacterium]